MGLPAVESDGTSNAYVEVTATANRKLVETQARGQTISPNWNEEYYIVLPSNAETLTFNIIHYNRIMKNVPLGTVQVNLGQINASNMGAELRLPLQAQGAPQSSHAAGSGELIVIVRMLPITRAETNQVYVARPYAPLRLQLERFVYFPGEVVRANLIVQVPEANGKSIDWIHVEATGKTHMEFRSEQSLIPTSHMDYVTKKFINPSDYTWFSVRASVLGLDVTMKGAAAHLNRGLHVWSIEFPLPATLPPTYNRQSFWSVYNLTMLVSIAGKVQTFAKELFICPLLNAIPPTLNTPFAPILAAPSTVPSALKWSNPPVISAGFPFDVTFDFTNQSNESFSSVSVHLRTLRVYTVCANGQWLANTFLEEYCSAATAGASMPGTQITATVTLRTQVNANNNNLYMSVPDHMCPELIHVYHYLELEGHNQSGLPVSLGRTPVYFTFDRFFSPFLHHQINPVPPNTRIAVFRVAKVENDALLRAMTTPTGHWLHEDLHATQTRTILSKIEAVNTAAVLSPADFEAQQPVTPLFTTAQPALLTPFPMDVAIPIRIEHQESGLAGAKPSTSTGTSGVGNVNLSLNSNLGINASWEPVSLNSILNGNRR